MLVPTTATRPKEMKRGFQFIKNHLENLKNVDIIDTEKYGNPSMVVLPTGIKKPKILICAHLDVVDYPSSSAFTSKIENERIVGPGAGDMKGSLAIALEIFRFFHSEHTNVSLGLVVSSDEEQGGASGIGYLVKEKNLQCELALVPDGGSLNKVTTHEKGVLHIKVTSHGRYSHASRPWEGDNALLRLIKNLNQIEKIFCEFKGQDNNWFATCSPTIIGTSNDVINRIPERAEAGLDIRFPQPHTAESILKKIEDVTEKPFDMEVLIQADPSELKPDPLYFKITEEITKQRVEEVRDHGGSDARFFSAKGTPVIVSRPLVGNLHSEEEWIDIPSMVTFYRIYEAYIEKRARISSS